MSMPETPNTLLATLASLKKLEQLSRRGAERALACGLTRLPSLPCPPPERKGDRCTAGNYRHCHACSPMTGGDKRWYLRAARVSL